MTTTAPPATSATAPTIDIPAILDRLLDMRVGDRVLFEPPYGITLGEYRAEVERVLKTTPDLAEFFWKVSRDASNQYVIVRRGKDWEDLGRPSEPVQVLEVTGSRACEGDGHEDNGYAPSPKSSVAAATVGLESMQKGEERFLNVPSCMHVITFVNRVRARLRTNKVYRGIQFGVYQIEDDRTRVRVECQGLRAERKEDKGDEILAADYADSHPRVALTVLPDPIPATEMVMEAGEVEIEEAQAIEVQPPPTPPPPTEELKPAARVTINHTLADTSSPDPTLSRAFEMVIREVNDWTASILDSGDGGEEDQKAVAKNDEIVAVLHDYSPQFTGLPEIHRRADRLYDRALKAAELEADLCYREMQRLSARHEALCEVVAVLKKTKKVLEDT